MVQITAISNGDSATVTTSSVDNVRPRLSDRLRRRTTSGAYFPEIDGLRFLAIAPVVLQHLSERLYRAQELRGAVSEFDSYVYSLLPSGYLGVQLFFVISGYIICLPLAKRATAAPERRPEFHYGFYMLRRLTRLEPPYLLVLSVTFLAVTLVTAAGMTSLTEGTVAYSVGSVPLPLSYAASLVYAHGVLFHALPRLNPPAWSLEIEFQFYVLAPAIILLCLAVGRRLRSFPAVVIAMVVVVLAMKLATLAWVPTDLQRYLVSKYVEFFVLGFVLSFLYTRGVFRKPMMGAAATPLFLSGIALAWYADHWGMAIRGMDKPHIRILMLIACAAMFGGALSGGVGRRFTSATWIATIGGMCYTIYLLHLMLFQVTTRVLLRLIPVHDILSGTIIYGILLIPLMLIVSAVFFLLVEKPCMDPQWPQKLYRAARRLLSGEKAQTEAVQRPGSTP
jgi:peptidoglycan/LPS O-acetylase OafA/YrhL